MAGRGNAEPAKIAEREISLVFSAFLLVLEDRGERFIELPVAECISALFCTTRNCALSRQQQSIRHLAEQQPQSESGRGHQ